MYDAHEFLHRIDQHKWPVLVVCALAMLGNYLYFFEAARVARRDRIVTIPMFCTFFWFAHDLSFDYRYDRWFHHYDHWYVKLFWCALVITVCFEAFYLVQIIQYGREEVLPAATQTQWIVLVVVAQLGAIAAWEAVKYVLDDPVYAASFGLANMSFPFMGAAMALRRRSMRGQTPLMMAGFLLLVVSWAVVNTIWFGPEFRTTQWVLLEIAYVSGVAGLLYASVRWPGTPASQPEAAAQPERTLQPA